MRIWRGRHAEPLIIIWAVAVLLFAALYKTDDIQPALADLTRPVYVIVVAVALLLTWKWFRTRATGPFHDRRHRDRRRSDRRDEDEGET